MTRVNLIPPTELHDQHLIAEIREINQLASHFKRSINAKSKFIIPNEFTLNRGHVTFFYNKGFYLHKRFDKLKREAILRGFNIKTVFNNQWVEYPEYYNDWNPTESAYIIILNRINEKIKMKPTFYRKTNHKT